MGKDRCGLDTCGSRSLKCLNSNVEADFFCAFLFVSLQSDQAYLGQQLCTCFLRFGGGFGCIGLIFISASNSSPYFPNHAHWELIVTPLSSVRSQPFLNVAMRRLKETAGHEPRVKPVSPHRSSESSGAMLFVSKVSEIILIDQLL